MSPQHSSSPTEGKHGAQATSHRYGDPQPHRGVPSQQQKWELGLCRQWGFVVVNLLLAKGSDGDAACPAKPGEICIHPSPVKPDMFYMTGKRRSINNSFLLVKLRFCFIDSEITFGDHLLLLYWLVCCD